METYMYSISGEPQSKIQKIVINTPYEIANMQ